MQEEQKRDTSIKANFRPPIGKLREDRGWNLDMGSCYCRSSISGREKSTREALAYRIIPLNVTHFACGTSQNALNYKYKERPTPTAYRRVYCTSSVADLRGRVNTGQSRSSSGTTSSAWDLVHSTNVFTHCSDASATSSLRAAGRPEPPFSPSPARVVGVRTPWRGFDPF
jgi:hypothetical protein